MSCADPIPRWLTIAAVALVATIAAEAEASKRSHPELTSEQELELAAVEHALETKLRGNYTNLLADERFRGVPFADFYYLRYERRYQAGLVLLAVSTAATLGSTGLWVAHARAKRLEAAEESEDTWSLWPASDRRKTFAFICSFIAAGTLIGGLPLTIHSSRLLRRLAPLVSDDLVVEQAQPRARLAPYLTPNGGGAALHLTF